MTRQVIAGREAERGRRWGAVELLVGRHDVAASLLSSEPGFALGSTLSFNVAFQMNFRQLLRFMKCWDPPTVDVILDQRHAHDATAIPSMLEYEILAFGEKI